MAASTANVDTIVQPGEIFAHPVKAATKLYAGTLALIVAATGYAQPGSDVTGTYGVGLVDQQADNTSGAAAAINVKLRRNCYARVKYTGTAPTRGGNVYVSDDQTVAITTTNSAGVMKVIDVFTATTECIVYIPK